MITVCLSEANFEYDIHSLVKAFYGKEDVKVFADKERICGLEQEETPLFHLEISYLYGAGSMGGAGAGVAGREKDKIEICLFLPPAAGAGMADGDKAASGAEAAAFDKAPSGVGPASANKVGDAAVRQKGLAFKDGGYFLGAQRAAEADFSDRKETKNILKRCLYRLLSAYTGQTLPWGTLTGIRPTKIAMSMLEQGAREEEVKDFMAGTYLASEQKVDLSIEIAKREMRLLEPIGYQEGYSLYVGIPFCPSICSYCSFSSSPIGVWEDKVDAYLAALAKEMEFTANACAHKKLNSVYIGGGTPTTLSPQQIDFLLSEIERRFDLSDLVEYTVEAGRPDSITREKLKALHSHGISRISINPQTMKQETLDIIGRCHTVAQTVESFWLAREMGFDNINMDLIVGLPGETIEDVEHTMRQVACLRPESLTIHSLAMKRAARLRMFPEDYQGMEMQNTWEIIGLTARYAREMGLLPYYLYRQKNMAGNFENVGYAAPGKSGLYNILMMEEKQSILALGAGAVTKYVFEPEKETGNIRVERTENVKNITQYIERIDEMIARKRAGIEECLKP